MKDFKKMPKMASGGSVEEDFPKGKIKPVPMPQIGSGKPRTVNMDGNEVEMKSIPMPQLKGGEGGRDIPGLGKIKPVQMPQTRGNLELLKKGGKARRNKK
jgi:hypothetical protein